MSYVVWYACASVNEGPLRKGEFLHSYKRRNFATLPEQVHRKTNSIAIAEEAANDGVKSGDNGKWRRMQRGSPYSSLVDTKGHEAITFSRGHKGYEARMQLGIRRTKIGSRFYTQQQMSDLDLHHQTFDSTAGEPTSRRETENLTLSHILMRKIPKSRFMNFWRECQNMLLLTELRLVS